MVKISFTGIDGKETECEAAEGASLLEVGQAAGLPLEGTCEGQMACSTCHVIVASDWFAKLPEASEEEEDMLDLAYGVERTSRLSCQIEVTAELDGLSVKLPTESRDMSRL
jgi:ferredoxin